MLFLATALIVIGVVTALMGERLFRLVLPIMGLVAGVMVGYSGVQAVFGVGVISTTIAVMTGIILGAIMAVLSYLYFGIAVGLLTVLLSIYFFTYLGLVFGLGDNGFWLFLMGFAGAVVGLAAAITFAGSGAFVIFVTSFYGVALLFTGIMLMAGSVTLNDLQNNGVVATVSEAASNHFLWLLAWVGGGLLASNIQINSLKRELMDTMLAFENMETK